MYISYAKGELSLSETIVCRHSTYTIVMMIIIINFNNNVFVTQWLLVGGTFKIHKKFKFDQNLLKLEIQHKYIYMHQKKL